MSFPWFFPFFVFNPWFSLYFPDSSQKGLFCQFFQVFPGLSEPCVNSWLRKVSRIEKWLILKLYPTQASFQKQLQTSLQCQISYKKCLFLTFVPISSKFSKITHQLLSKLCWNNSQLRLQSWLKWQVEVTFPNDINYLSTATCI